MSIKKVPISPDIGTLGCNGDNGNDIDRTVAHEFGHLLGLQHSKISENLMVQGELGTTLTSGQIKDAVSNYNNDMLNTGIPSGISIITIVYQ